MATLAEAGTDDATALLTTAIARSLTDDIEILVQVTDAESVPKAFGAGADYALSEQRTTARLLAAGAHGDRALHPIGGLRFARVDGNRFAGQRLGGADTRSEPGWVHVGVERDGSFRTDDAVEIAPTDTVVVAGTDEQLRDFE